MGERKERSILEKVSKGEYYITPTAIAYTSGKAAHLETPYEAVLADSIASLKDGYDVFFQTGTDEHGQKIEAEGPGSRCDAAGYVGRRGGGGEGPVGSHGEPPMINLSVPQMRIVQTQVQKIFKRLYDQGIFTKGHYEGLYCTPAESLLDRIPAGRRQVPGLRQREVSKAPPRKDLFLQNEQICGRAD